MKKKKKKHTRTCAGQGENNDVNTTKYYLSHCKTYLTLRPANSSLIREARAETAAGLCPISNTICTFTSRITGGKIARVSETLSAWLPVSMTSPDDTLKAPTLPARVATAGTVPVQLAVGMVQQI
jgi:hypothetical protein